MVRHLFIFATKLLLEIDKRTSCFSQHNMIMIGPCVMPIYSGSWIYLPEDFQKTMSEHWISFDNMIKLILCKYLGQKFVQCFDQSSSPISSQNTTTLLSIIPLIPPSLRLIEIFVFSLSI